MNDTIDVAGAIIGLAVVILLPNLVTIYCSIYSIVRDIRWSLIVRFGGGIVVYSEPSYCEKVAWRRIASKIESEKAKGFKFVDMVRYTNSDGTYAYEALLKEVK